MPPEPVEAVVEHIDMLRRLGFPTGPDAYLVPNERGGRISQKKLRRIVREAALAASECMVALKQRIKRDHGRSLDEFVRAGRQMVAQPRP